jgi:hypothetical protein
VPEVEARSLVQRTMSGRFVPVEGRPEAAALQRLDLDEEQRERAREVVEQRALSIALLLVDEIDTVREITDQITTGRRDAAREGLREIWRNFEPGAPRDPLLEPLSEVLTSGQIDRLRRLLDEYWDAWIDWELRGSEERREDPEARKRVARRLGFRLFEREVRRGYDASLRHYRQALEGITNAVAPTDKQREAIRSLVIDHIRQTRLEATPEQRRAVMLEIYRLLDPERRERLFEYMTRAVIPD